MKPPTPIERRLHRLIQRLPFLGVAHDWLCTVLVRAADWVRGTAGPWIGRHYWWILICLGLLLGLFAIVWYLAEIAVALRALVERLSLDAANPRTEPEDIRNLATGIAVLLGATAASATLIFQLVRLYTTERSTRTAEQNLITTQINKAVEGLGAEKTVKRRVRPVSFSLLDTRVQVYSKNVTDWLCDVPEGATDCQSGEIESFEGTVPNIEVRIGAIFALERIAQNSLDDHVQIMEILTTYLRENSPASTAAVFLEPYPEPLPKSAGLSAFRARKEHLKARRQRYNRWAQTLNPGPDIQATIRILGRRNKSQIARETADIRHGPDGYRIDLRGTNLQGIDFSRLNFANARFDGAHLERADFSNGNFRRAELRRAHLGRALFQETDLVEAKLQEADLEFVRFINTDFGDHADFALAKVRGASFMPSTGKKTSMNGANFLDADLEGTDFTKVQLNGANLQTALITVCFRNCDLKAANLCAAVFREVLFQVVTFDENTDFGGASFQWSAMSNVDLELVDLDQTQVSGLFGDASVILHCGPEQPPHWTTGQPNGDAFILAWENWMQSSDAASRSQDGGA